MNLMGLAVDIVLTCIEHIWFVKVVHVDKNKETCQNNYKKHKKKLVAIYMNSINIQIKITFKLVIFIFRYF